VVRCGRGKGAVNAFPGPGMGSADKYISCEIR
jgi:hypothetical protein